MVQWDSICPISLILAFDWFRRRCWWFQYAIRLSGDLEKGLGGVAVRVMWRLGTQYWVSALRIFYRSVSSLEDFLAWFRCSVWRMLVCCHALFSVLPTEQKPHGGQQMMRQHGMMKCSTNLSELDVSLLRSWRPKNPPTSWLVKDVTANRERCRSCYHFLSIHYDQEQKLVSVALDCIPCVGWYGVLHFFHS